MANENKQAPAQETAQPKKNASQRLDALENAFMSLYHTVDNIARDLLTTKEAVKLLGNKIDAIVKVTQRGEDLTDDSISAVMIENNVEELKGRIAGLVEKGVLAVEEQVNENSFVVGRELDQDGTVVNPRLQFALKAMPPETQSKIKGGKAGDLITIEEGKLRFELLETYSISQPKAPAPAQETAAEQSSEAAPAPAGNA